MKIIETTKKDDVYELLVEMSVFGCTYQAKFIGTHDVKFATRMCEACPLHKDCFEEDTLKYELCCMLELLYQTPLEKSGIGVLYMLPKYASEIKNMIDDALGRLESEENISESSKQEKEPKITLIDDLDEEESKPKQEESRKFKFR